MARTKKETIRNVLEKRSFGLSKTTFQIFSDAFGLVFPEWTIDKTNLRVKSGNNVGALSPFFV